MRPGDLVGIKFRNIYYRGYLCSDPHITYYIRDLNPKETGVVLDVFRRARYSKSYKVVMGGDTGWVEEENIEVLK